MTRSIVFFFYDSSRPQNLSMMCEEEVYNFLEPW